MSTSQGELALIEHKVEHRVIQQRAADGYINATAMCQAAGKLFGNYYQLQTTKAFLAELEADIGIPITELVQRVRGGHPELQGTWVHPYVAMNLAQWCSPKFAVRVSKWVTEWLTGRIPSHIPDHVLRYVINQPKIPPTHFSMLNQMMLRLLAPLERHGYILPDRLMPDISLGRMFSKRLRERGYDPADFPTYRHVFLDHRPTVPARLYPNELLTAFNLDLDDWLRDGRARKYFGDRDEKAIVPLDRVIASLPAPPKQLGPGSTNR